MSYPHWRLGKGDTYQLGIARMRVVTMLDAYSKGIDGPLALACEIPVEGWDDIVEYGADGGQITATHYQVKLQNSDFKAKDRKETFEVLFANAAKVLASPNPYDGLGTPPTKRSFRFVFPTDETSVGGSLGIDQLRGLLAACAGTAADAIVGNNGKNLLGKGKKKGVGKATGKDKDKDKGEQKQAWLELIRAATGTEDACKDVLRNVRVDVQPTSWVDAHSAPILAQLFEDPKQAQQLIDEALRGSAPEGWLDPDELLPKLGSAKPKPQLRQVRVCQSGQAFYVRPHPRNADVAAVARAIVAEVWNPHGPADLHLGFVTPGSCASAGSRALRLACVRLLLHTTRSPVHVVGQPTWFERTRIDVKRVLGVTVPTPALDEGHFIERAAPGCLPPKKTWEPEDLAKALHAAMDAHVWEHLRLEGHQLLGGAQNVPFDDLAAACANLDDFLGRVLHGWWGLEANISGVARAGRAVSRNVAYIVAGLAVVRSAGYNTSVINDRPAIARIGKLPLCALALDQAARTLDGAPHGVSLVDHARDVLSFAGIVLLVRGDVNDFYTFAAMGPLDEIGAGGNLQREVPPALLLNSESLVAAAKVGPSAVTDLIQRWGIARGRQHNAELAAALDQNRESHAT